MLRKFSLALTALVLVASIPVATPAESNFVVRVTNEANVCAHIDVIATTPRKARNPESGTLLAPQPPGEPVPVGPMHKLWAQPHQTVEVSSADFLSGVQVTVQHGIAMGCTGTSGSWSHFAAVPNPGETSLHLYFRLGPRAGVYTLTRQM